MHIIILHLHIIILHCVSTQVFSKGDAGHPTIMLFVRPLASLLISFLIGMCVYCVYVMVYM